MAITSIGDLAQTFASRRQQTELTRILEMSGRELTTGLRADVSGALKGLTKEVSAIDRGLARLDGFKLASSEAKLVADATQSTLASLRQRVGQLASQSALAIQGSDPTSVKAAASAGRQQFLSFVSDLNLSVAGRTMFGGIADAAPALRGGADMLADIVATVSGATTAQDVVDGIDAYFAPGGLFEANDYLASTISREPLRVGPGEVAELPLRADDARIRPALKALARAAVIDAGVLGGDPSEAAALLSRGTALSLSAERDLISLEAETGAVQARIAVSQTRNAAERDTLAFARLDLVGADRFEAATRLEQTENQLEALYTVTARLSRLNLTAYL